MKYNQIIISKAVLTRGPRNLLFATSILYSQKPYLYGIPSPQSLQAFQDVNSLALFWSCHFDTTVHNLTILQYL